MYINGKVYKINMGANNVLIARRIALFNSEMNKQKNKGMFFCDLERLKELKKEREKIKSVLRRYKISEKPDSLLSSIHNEGEVKVDCIIKSFK